MGEPPIALLREPGLPGRGERDHGADPAAHHPLTLWVPGPLPGLNEIVAAAKGFGGRGYGYSKLKRKWTDDVALLAKAARLPKVTSARFHFRWFEKTRRRNPDNICAGGRKMILDGLVTAGVLENDGWGQVAGWSDEWVIHLTLSGVAVQIEPV